jgi:hypothetical protein
MVDYEYLMGYVGLLLWVVEEWSIPHAGRCQGDMDAPSYGLRAKKQKERQQHSPRTTPQP